MTRRHARALVLVAAAVAGSATALGEQPFDTTREQPRFRGGAHLVRVDAYVTADGRPVTDLTAEDFEVFEDGVLQQVESFELVQPRPPGPVSERREPNTVAESREMAREASARVFVIFMDIWHVQIAGSYRAGTPIATLLARVIGQDDLVGVMTPDMTGREVTLARRPETIDSIFRDHWYWGERGRFDSSDSRDDDLRLCYPDSGGTQGIADALIRRRQAARTLRALEDLVMHLEGIREERKFVLLLSEGWVPEGPDQQLARPLDTDGDGRGDMSPLPRVGTDPRGRLDADADPNRRTFSACERERAMLAFSDQEREFLQLLQRANRANVSFYPIDARGLVAFDEPIGPARPPAPSVDAARLRERRSTLRTLAEITDGFAIVDVNDVGRAVARIVLDTGSYYLLGYYSTNTRLDGRFRTLTVRVKRPGLEVRARPGYLAPSEAELASQRVEALVNGAAPGYTTIPPVVSRALDALAPSLVRAPLRVQAAAGASGIWVAGEIDAEVVGDAWGQGGRVRVQFDHESGAAPPARTELVLDAVQHAFVAASPSDQPLAPGRYVVRLELLDSRGAPITSTSTDAVVPAPTALLGTSGLVYRRGPWTGREYVPTVDARFRRTERIRLEVPRGAGSGQATARLLGRDGRPLAVALTVGERVDASSGQRMIVAEAVLAPLAQGDYVLEVAVEHGDRRDSIAYAFRIVP